MIIIHQVFFSERFEVVLFSLQWWQNDKISCLRLFQDSKSIHGLNLLQLLLRGTPETRRYLSDIMHKVFVLYKEGKIKPVVDSVFTFDDVGEKKSSSVTDFVFFHRLMMHSRN